jgi:hypothetical protein
MVTTDVNAAPRQLVDRDVAVYFFTVHDSADRSVLARLIVIPKSEVIDPPTATSFLAVPPLYKSAYCTTAWVEGPLVYVCCVNAGEDVLRTLQHRAV